MRVGVDIDGVIRDFVGSVLKVYKRVYPEHRILPVNSYGLQPFFPDYQGKISNFYSVDYAGEIYGKARVLPGSCEMLRQLQMMGHTVVLVTAQPNDGVTDITREWVRFNMIPHDELVFATDKSKVDVAILLDDGMHNLKACEGSRVRPVAWDKSWNKGWVGRRVSNYTDFIKDVLKRDSELKSI